MELNYDIDNFSGRYNRGIRYDIYDGNNIIYHDISEDEVDILTEQMERKPWLYSDIKVVEINK